MDLASATQDLWELHHPTLRAWHGWPSGFFCQPVPAPMNTIPVWVRVWLPPWVCAVHCGFLQHTIFLYILKYIKYKLSTKFTIITSSTCVWSKGGDGGGGCHQEWDEKPTPPSCLEQGRESLLSLSLLLPRTERELPPSFGAREGVVVVVVAA